MAPLLVGMWVYPLYFLKHKNAAQREMSRLQGAALQPLELLPVGSGAGGVFSFTSPIMGMA